MHWRPSRRQAMAAGILLVRSQSAQFARDQFTRTLMATRSRRQLASDGTINIPPRLIAILGAHMAGVCSLVYK